MKTTRTYSMHGLHLTLSGEAGVVEALHARLGHFPSAPGHWSGAHLHFEFQPVPSAAHHWVHRPLGRSRPVLEAGAGEVAYFEATQELYLEIPPHGRARCDCAARRVWVSYVEDEAHDPWFLAHPFFTLPWAELLKREGLYMVHAAGLALAGKGLLVAGQSGAGKTTLALALLRAGFDFLADDTVFLAAGAAGLRLLAFPDEVDVTAQTLSFFPELHSVARASTRPGRLKQGFCATHFYGVEPCWECRPEVLLFPQPGRCDQSVLSPLPKSEALLQLLCNVLRTEAAASQAHLDALAQLVGQCRCYRLQTGSDFDRVPALLHSVLRGTKTHTQETVLTQTT